MLYVSFALVGYIHLYLSIYWNVLLSIGGLQLQSMVYEIINLAGAYKTKAIGSGWDRILFMYTLYISRQEMVSYV